MKGKKMIGKRYDILAVMLIVIVSSAILLSSHRKTPGEAAGGEGSTAKFAALSNAKTSFCSGPAFIAGKGEEERLQGACCSQMDFHRYQEQVEGLKKYAAIKEIPADPYDIPVSWANRFLEYGKSTKVTPEQQTVYDQAVKLSHEGGPCCCKCWRWYAFEGLAKYLISERGFTAEQIAEVWDLEDGCGGKGHEHGAGH